MTRVLLMTVALCVAWLTGSCLWSIRFPERRTWPPLRRSGIVYRINAFTGPFINFPIFALSFVGWDTFALGTWARILVGGPIFALGAYLSLGGVFRLGMHRTQGNEGELEETGPYRLTRNPQYTGAICSFFGLAVLCNSRPGLVGALIASIWFLILPFAEEPWLREKLGTPYEEYASRVPRFLSLRALLSPRFIGIFRKDGFG